MENKIDWKYWLVEVGIPAIILVALFATITMCTGCGASITGARSFQSLASKSVYETAEAYDKYDAKEQDRVMLAAPEGKAFDALESYLANQQKPIRTVFVSVTFALDAFSDALNAEELGQKQDWLGLLFKFIEEGKKLIAILEKYKVPIKFKLPSLGDK